MFQNKLQQQVVTCRNANASKPLAATCAELPPVSWNSPTVGPHLCLAPNNAWRRAKASPRQPQLEQGVDFKPPAESADGAPARKRCGQDGLQARWGHRRDLRKGPMKLPRLDETERGPPEAQPTLPATDAPALVPSRVRIPHHARGPTKGATN